MQNTAIIAQLIATLAQQTIDDLHNTPCGPNNFHGYDLLENLTDIHYELTHGKPMPLEIEIEDYIANELHLSVNLQ